jgi:hypothetical protein
MKGERALSYHELMEVLRQRVDVLGSQRRAAQVFGVSGPYLCDVLLGRRLPAEKLLTALGYQKLTLYTRRVGSPWEGEGLT